ncbi:MAG: agmatine deiminase family protein, partial [Bdellovibrionales bacterium]
PTFVRNGDQILPIDFEYRKGSKEDEFIQFFSSLGFISPSKKIDLKLATGNLQIDDLGNCFLSRTVLKDDSYESKVRDQLINEIGCVKVILLPRITFEATGHLDMWMKYLSKNRFIVSEVTTETIEAQTLMDKSLIPPLLDAKKDLDKSAKILADLGYSVLRVPILPFNFTSGDKGGRPVFRSYANSLILNKTLYVPSFVHFYHLNWGPELNSKLGWIEKSAFEVLKQLDFRIKAIDADDLVVEAGAIHCSFLQMPNGALLRPSNTKPQVRP